MKYTIIESFHNQNAVQVDKIFTGTWFLAVPVPILFTSLVLRLALLLCYLSPPPAAVMLARTWDPRPRRSTRSRTWCPRPRTHIKPNK